VTTGRPAPGVCRHANSGRELGDLADARVLDHLRAVPACDVHSGQDGAIGAEEVRARVEDAALSGRLPVLG
jgi:hypothetical protein